MKPLQDITAPDSPWTPYKPTPDAPWNLSRVVHLHRRAGFSASWPEIERDRKDGPDASISRVLNGSTRLGGTPPDFESTSSLLADSAVASGDLHRLQAWWVFRMLYSPDPLAERLSLMWHNHFASAFSKVEDLSLMRLQNDTFRRLGRAPFADLLTAALQQPALLLYLDAPGNRPDHPNENLARELMELFTLGIGHYSESDVKEAARALSGWTVSDGSFHISRSQHDDGEKHILGHKGRFNGSDLLTLLIRHPATALRLAWRLCGLLMGENTVDGNALDLLANHLRNNNLNIGLTVGLILRSRAFFAPQNLRARVLGPPEFIIGLCRALVPPDTPPSTLLLAEWITRLGQDLFNPPNVGGWPEGRAWLSTRSLVARAHFASALVEGGPVGLSSPLDPRALAAQQGLDTSPRSVQTAASALLLGQPPTKTTCPETARQALVMTLASPEAQLG